jgi:hypothetical protein
LQVKSIQSAGEKLNNSKFGQVHPQVLQKQDDKGHNICLGVALVPLLGDSFA